MRIVMTGLSHRTAPLATREAVSVTRDELPEALHALKETVGRGVILSTCNRTEVYTIARDAETARRAISEFFGARGHGDGLQPYLYDLEQDDAVRHLFRVTAGLDSLILGESEILGQVRDAYGIASRDGAASGALSHVFHSAIRTGKRARTETQISRNALSVSRACVELSRRTLGDLTTRHALIVGVGEASKLAAQALRDAGIGTITIANRTPENANELAGLIGADVAGLSSLQSLLAATDVVVSSTGAPDFVIDYPTVSTAATMRDSRSLLMIDLAMPRDIDPGVDGIEGVSVRTMEDLEAIAEANRKEREAEARKVEVIVDEEVAKFAEWWKLRGVTPTISSIRRHAESIREAEVAKTVAKMEGLTVEEAERLEAMTKSLVKKLLHEPTRALRNRSDESFTQAARELFALDEG